jgi:hypothetical protein
LKRARLVVTKRPYGTTRWKLNGLYLQNCKNRHLQYTPPPDMQFLFQWQQKKLHPKLLSSQTRPYQDAWWRDVSGLFPTAYNCGQHTLGSHWVTSWLGLTVGPEHKICTLVEFLLCCMYQKRPHREAEVWLPKHLRSSTELYLNRRTTWNPNYSILLIRLRSSSGHGKLPSEQSNTNPSRFKIPHMQHTHMKAGLRHLSGKKYSFIFDVINTQAFLLKTSASE